MILRNSLKIFQKFHDSQKFISQYILHLLIRKSLSKKILQSFDLANLSLVKASSNKDVHYVHKRKLKASERFEEILAFIYINFIMTGSHQEHFLGIPISKKMRNYFRRKF